MTQIIDDYTIVVGVDSQHLKELALVYPTWVKHKPSLLKRRMKVFFDESVIPQEIINAAPHPTLDWHPWPSGQYGHGAVYERTVEGKWGCPQRAKMLAGYVFIPAMHVKTKYWLKLDTDTLATGHDDWVDPNWLSRRPAIVAQKWGLTKPANQMHELDDWVATYDYLLPTLAKAEPLNLIPEEGARKLKHPRIISWCGFFHTQFTQDAAAFAARTEHIGHLPEPSQDGYMFYLAKRLGLLILREKMSARGWRHCTSRRLPGAVRLSLGDENDTRRESSDRDIL